jgi:hypothetical protein
MFIANKVCPDPTKCSKKSLAKSEAQQIFNRCNKVVMKYKKESFLFVLRT